MVSIFFKAEALLDVAKVDAYFEEF